MGARSRPAGDHEQVVFDERGAWRAWLRSNHQDSVGVWLVLYKKSAGTQAMGYDHSVEEALCFGWVDSRKKSLDARRYALLFTPRNPKSPWSRPNKERVERLVRDGRMAQAGRLIVEQAKQNGAWTVYDPIEDLVVPQDLAAALSAEESAERNFQAMTVGVKKKVLWWIASAVRPDTRARRIARTAAAAARNRSPL